MTLKEEPRILDNKIRQNKANYDLYRQNAKISALSSGELDKYEYLTDKDLGYKPDPIEKTRFEYSPLGQGFNKELKTDEKKEGLLKRLKNIADKTDNQLDLIRKEVDRQLERSKGLSNFYNGTDREIIELENRAIKETIENMTDTEKVFGVKISGKNFNINKYSNLSYFGNLLFNKTISLEEAKEQQNKVLNIIDELEKKLI